MATLDLVAPTPGITDPEVLASASDWESFFAPFLADGIAAGMTPSLDATGRNAVIAAGSAYVRAYIAKAASPNATAIPAASAKDRIDRLVLRLDRTASTKTTWVQPVVITGVPAASPVAPPLQATPDAQWDLPVARWTSAASGALAGLIDERPMLAGPVLALGANPAAPPGGGTPRLAFQGGRLIASMSGTAWDTLIWAALDAWHPMTLASGWTTLAGWGIPKYRIDRGLLQLAGTLKSDGASSGSGVATLPQGYYDTVERGCGVSVQSLGGPQWSGGWLGLDTSGHLTFTAQGSGAFLVLLDGITLPIGT
jgi:hypothetical protein